MLRRTKRVIMLLICGTVLFTQPVFAMGNDNNTDIHNYKYLLNEMAKDDKFDLVGWKGEQLYFDLRNEYAQGNLLKQIAFDIMTLDSQYKLLAKTYRQNDLLYDVFFVAGGVKYAIKTGKIAWSNKVYLGKTLKGAEGIFKALKRY